MLKISRNEAFMLRENGRGRDVHVTNRTHKKVYYVTESEKSMKILNRYRDRTTHSVCKEN